MFFATRGTLHEELQALIRNLFTPDEFEKGWHELLEKHNAKGEAHLDRIFDIRDQWVPAYFMNKFFPFTSSTGRSESTNSLFKSYVKRKDSVKTFFEQYLMIQEKKQADLDQLREKSEFKESSNWSYNPIEREAMKIYTDPIYGKFSKEMKKSTAYNIEIIIPDRTFNVIRVAPYRNAEFPRTTYTVEVTSDGGVYSCTCCKMERDGIQCCHVLRVATHRGLTELPTSFIKGRWTTEAGQEVARLTSQTGKNGCEKTHLAVRHAIEMSKVSHMLSTVCTDDRSYDLFAEGVSKLKKVIVEDTLQRMQEKQKKSQKRRKIDDPQPEQPDVEQQQEESNKFNGDLNLPPHNKFAIPIQQDIQQDETVKYKDPNQSGNPGFNLGDRPKSYYEQSAKKILQQKKERKCGLCRKPGHKRPSCPDKDKVLLH
jgi:hypothetical protein